MFKHGLCLFLVFCASPALAGEEPLRPRFEGNARLGTERSIGMTEAWVPVWQDLDETGQPERVVYTDLRFMADDLENQEGNLGFGYRSLTPSNDAVWGIHGWFDRRKSDNGGKFNQITIGGEWFTPKYELRGNIYAPLSDAHEFITDPGRDPYLAGSQIIVDPVGRAVERPLKGLDLELGYTLPLFTDTLDSVRVYGGGYHFYDDDAENVTGWRTRIAADITSDFQIGARFQRDDERGSQSFLEATVRFPFGIKSSYRQKGVRARLDESPERDIDIVTGDKVITPGGAPAPAVNATTGVAQRVLYVDNTVGGGGDGSVERPFNTILGAEAALQPYDIVYVARGDGTTTGYTTGFLLNQTGARLIGSGDDFIYDGGFLSAPSGSAPSGKVLRAATSAPKITNAAGGGLKAGDAVAVTAANTKISGIDIQTANRFGIRNLGFDNMVVERVNISGTTNNGIQVSDASHISISNTTITNAAQRGMDIRPTIRNMDDIKVDNVTVTSSANRGITIGSPTNGLVLTNVKISNIDMTGVGSNGLELSASNGGRFSGLTVNNVDIRNPTVGGAGAIRLESNGVGSRLEDVSVDNATLSGYGEGISLNAVNGGAMGKMELSHITAIGNLNRGISFFASGASVVDRFILQNSNLRTNASQGVAIDIRNNSVFSDVQIKNNIFSNNTSYGLYMTATNDAVFSRALLEGNTFSSNNSHGLFINDDSTGSITVDVGGGVAGGVGRNRIFNNTGADIRVDLDGGELKAENNWWGVGTGLTVGETVLEDASTIDSTPFLNVDPGL